MRQYSDNFRVSQSLKTASTEDDFSSRKIFSFIDIIENHISKLNYEKVTPLLKCVLW